MINKIVWRAIDALHEWHTQTTEQKLESERQQVYRKRHPYLDPNLILVEGDECNEPSNT